MFAGKIRGVVEKLGFTGFMVENGRFTDENWGFRGKIGVFIEKWGFRGILVKNSGKSRKEPGI